MTVDRKNGGKTETGKFAPGNTGRPKGARNKTTVAIEALLEGEAEAIGRKCIAKALEGDGMALKLAMERLAPVRRGRPVTFELPDVFDSAVDLSRYLGTVLKATASGALTTDEALQISHIIEARRRAFETEELEQRIAALEQMRS